MTKCPYCGTESDSIPEPPSLSKRQGVIYNAIAESGTKGVQMKKLISLVYEDTPPLSAGGVIRVTIFEINRRIKERGQRIKGRKDAGYILIADPQ